MLIYSNTTLLILKQITPPTSWHCVEGKCFRVTHFHIATISLFRLKNNNTPLISEVQKGITKYEFKTKTEIIGLNSFKEPIQNKTYSIIMSRLAV